MIKINMEGTVTSNQAWTSTGSPGPMCSKLTVGSSSKIGVPKYLGHISNECSEVKGPVTHTTTMTLKHDSGKQIDVDDASN